MLDFAKRVLTSLLDKTGRALVPKAELRWPIEFAQALGQQHDTAGGELKAIVFSKDRAMQLHAFLSSYLELAANPAPITVLYAASTAEHARSYADLEKALGSGLISFVAERNFRDDLIAHASDPDCAKILTFVDDMMFKEAIDFDALRQINTGAHILSLTRGRDLTYSSVLQKPVAVPALTPAFGPFLTFDWRGPEFSDWTFPLGVSGYLFGRREWLAMITTLKFKAPNSLEAALQSYNPIYEVRSGLCTDRAICVCVHANMVQSELPNPTLGNFSVENLLRVWQQGLMIDRRRFYNKDLRIAESQDYSFVPRQ